jgi:hypothetical protein
MLLAKFVKLPRKIMEPPSASRLAVVPVDRENASGANVQGTVVLKAPGRRPVPTVPDGKAVALRNVGKVRHSIETRVRAIKHESYGRESARQNQNTNQR